MTNTDKLLRPIRSFVLRQGRMTLSQHEAISDGWSQFGVELSMTQDVFDWNKIFAREAPRVLEIGFGMGDSLITLAKQHPEMDFLGIEVHRPGIARTIANAKSQGLTNLKIFSEDAVEVLKAIHPASLDRVLLFFADPWPKKKHHKRRIVQAAFVETVAQKLKIQGQFRLATDWQDYADHMLAVLDKSPTLRNCFGEGQYAPSPFERPMTKFELRGQKLGHVIRDLVYERC